MAADEKRSILPLRRLIARSAWPGIAERLLTHNVKIFDGAGVAWRPRLQTTSQAPKKRAARKDKGKDKEMKDESAGARRPARKRRRVNYYSDDDEDDAYAFDDFAVAASLDPRDAEHFAFLRSLADEDLDKYI